MPEYRADSAVSAKQSDCFGVLGTEVAAVQNNDVIDTFQDWIQDRRASRYVAVCNVHMVVEARRSPSFRKVLDNAALVIPDGSPLIWLGRRSGYSLIRRCYGPDLFQEFATSTATKGYRHFLYGGHPGVELRVAERLKRDNPGLVIAGTLSPPFRKVTVEEDDEIVRTINASRADILWVALGCPRQEIWMYEHRDRLEVPVVVGVGQAFDIYAGRVAQAPKWMREHGLEWFFRLLMNPRRLWRRYLIYNSEFALRLLVARLTHFFPWKTASN
jgi:N-acetylglucosaminyldiphosphoundecaprenol N-acetyl-beta-D-mannosaminyltransferase